MTYTVRVSGNAPVWADIKIEAESPKEALRKVSEGDSEIDIAHQADWQFCDGGNGVDDWTTTGDVEDEDGLPVMEDGELINEVLAAPVDPRSRLLDLLQSDIYTDSYEYADRVAEIHRLIPIVFAGEAKP